MAKDEIDRASRAGVEEVAVASKQHDAADLLKKMKVLPDADEKAPATESDHEHAVSDQQTASSDQTASASDSGAAVDGATAAASDATVFDFADAGSLISAASAGNEGISTGTLLAIGGVALVGGGIAIAASNGGGGHHDDAEVTAIASSAATVAEGDAVSFTVTGTPGATFVWTAANGTETFSGNVTIGDDGKGVITITPAEDNVTEAAQTLTVTVGDQTASVTVTDPAAQDQVLTQNQDSLDFSGTSGANHVNGVANGFSILVPGTFTVGDHIIGNGDTVLDLKVGLDGPQPLATLENLGAVNLVNAAGTGTASFNATLWTDVGSINLVDGADGMQAFFTDLEVGVGMSVAAGVAGAVVAEFTNDMVGGVSADHNSAISWVDNNVDATVAIGETAAFGISYSNPNALDITVGNISADVGKLGEFDVRVTDEGGPGALVVGDIDVTGGISSEFSLTVSASGQVAGATHDVTVGNISVALDMSSSVDASISNSGYNTVGDLTLGDVAVSVGDGPNASLDFTAYNYAYNSHASDDVTSGNVVVGDVALSVGDSGEAYLDIGNYADADSGSAVAGDVTVGNISLTGGDSASVTMYVSDTAYAGLGSGSATVGNVSVGDVTLVGGSGTQAEVFGEVFVTAQSDGSGGATVGNVSVGLVDVSVGDSGGAEFSVSVSASAEGGGNATVGDVSIGGLSMTAGAHVTDADLEITSSAYAQTSGNATVGGLTIGDISVSIGQSSSSSVTIEHYAYASSGDASVGDTTIGNMTLGVDTSASVEASISISASGNVSHDSTIGNVVIGDLVTDEGVNADVEYSLMVEATADGTGTATIGDVTIGAIDATLNDGATFDYSMSAYAHDSASTASIGVVSVGDISLFSTNGVSSSAGVSITVEAANGSLGGLNIGNISAVLGANANATVEIHGSGASIGDASVGDVTVTAGTGYFYGSFDLYATNGDIGNVAIGDIALSATGDGTAEYDMYVFNTGGDIGDISVGDITLNAHGTSAYVSAYLTTESDGAHDIGTITLGNVVMDVTGASADAYLYVSASSAASIGTLTVGGLDLSVNANVDAAVSEHATATVDLFNDGDIVIGDVSFNVGDAKGANPVTDANNFNFSISATGDVTLGVVSVTGGDQGLINGASFDDFAANVMGAVSTGGDITIGGVDYSGYGAAATIDVSAYEGAATIIGSAYGDTITDNAGTNAITGGTGADTFNFLDTNTGKTEATADKITDFLYSADHIHTGVGAGTLAEYTEGTYADFASFLANADSADKSLAAGQVGDNVFVAVDYNADNTVDYVIELTNTTLSNVAVDSFV